MNLPLDQIANVFGQLEDERSIGCVRRGEAGLPPQLAGNDFQLGKPGEIRTVVAVHDELVGPNEWWLTYLARELQMSDSKLRDWSDRGWVHYRKTPVQGYRILWADADEVQVRVLCASEFSK